MDVAPPKRKSGGGRTTPKGTRPGEQRFANPQTSKDGVDSSERYTPPVPEEWKRPNPYVPYIMVGLFLLGAVLIIVRNLASASDGDSFWAGNIVMFGGLACVLGGLYAATRWR